MTIDPKTIRDTNWQTLQATLAGRLKAVYLAWLAHGPATTRQLATASAIDILNVRPRTTDLAALGLVHCVATSLGEGVYQARSQTEWETWRADQIRASVSGQLQLL